MTIYVKVGNVRCPCKTTKEAGAFVHAVRDLLGTEITGVGELGTWDKLRMMLWGDELAKSLDIWKLVVAALITKYGGDAVEQMLKRD